MASRKPSKPLIDKDGEVRELTKADLAKFVPFAALPEEHRRVLLGLRRRGPQKAPKKVPISIRLSEDVVDGLRATGAGWQTRADKALREWLADSKGRSRGR